MGFVVNLLLFTAVKNFANRSRIEKVTAMVRVAPFLTHRSDFGRNLCIRWAVQGRAGRWHLVHFFPERHTRCSHTANAKKHQI